MSTRSRIGMIVAGEKVVSIYCHNDGYLSGVGLTLFNHYQNPLKSKEMLLLGDLSSIAPTIGTKHNFYEYTDKNQCNFYGRDRGEKDVDAVLHKSTEDFATYANDIEFSYIWVSGAWHVSSKGEPFRLLNNKLYNDILVNREEYKGKDINNIMAPITSLHKTCLVYPFREAGAPEPPRIPIPYDRTEVKSNVAAVTKKKIEVKAKDSLRMLGDLASTTPFQAFKEAGEKIFKENQKTKVDFSETVKYNNEKAATKPTKTFNLTETTMTTSTKTKNTRATAQISRTKLESFMRSQAGRFIGVESVLKNGENATFNGRVALKDNAVTGDLARPYICMYDNNRKGFRNVDLNTISKVTTNGIDYSII